jgi:hypothetical protein
MSRNASRFSKVLIRRLGVAIVIAATMGTPAPLRGAVENEPPLGADPARLHLFPEDSDPIAVIDTPDDSADLPRAALRSAPAMPQQVIIAPLPPAVVTALPLLAGMWATRRYKLWRRGH